jgi:hypothetical protein
MALKKCHVSLIFQTSVRPVMPEVADSSSVAPANKSASNQRLSFFELSVREGLEFFGLYHWPVPAQGFIRSRQIAVAPVTMATLFFGDMTNLSISNACRASILSKAREECAPTRLSARTVAGHGCALGRGHVPWNGDSSATFQSRQDRDTARRHREQNVDHMMARHIGDVIDRQHDA